MVYRQNNPVRTVLTTLASYPKICPPLLGLTHFLFLFLPLCALPLSSPDNPLAVPGSSLSNALTARIRIVFLSGSVCCLFFPSPLRARGAHTDPRRCADFPPPQSWVGLNPSASPPPALSADCLHHGYMFMVSDANSSRFQRPRSRRLRRCPSGPS